MGPGFYFFKRCGMRVDPIMILLAFRGIPQHLKKSQTDQRAGQSGEKNVCLVGFSGFFSARAWVFLCCRLLQHCGLCAGPTPRKLFALRGAFLCECPGSWAAGSEKIGGPSLDLLRKSQSDSIGERFFLGAFFFVKDERVRASAAYSNPNSRTTKVNKSQP